MALKSVYLCSAVAALLCSIQVASAEPACGKRDEIVGKLSQDFKEAPAAVGMVNSNALIEVFVSEAGTWTILATDTNGRSCIVSAGEGWQSQTIMAALPNA